MLKYIEIYKFGRIQTSETGGQLYSDTSPYKVSVCSLPYPTRLIVQKSCQEYPVAQLEEH